VYVATSTGTGFNAPALWISGFGYDSGGWRVDKHPRVMADVNGDNQDDIVAFGGAGAYVALSTGTGFATPSLWVNNYGYDAGAWRVDRHLRIAQDIDGDNQADIVGFGGAGAFISRSTGSSFGPAQLVSGMGYDAGGWRVGRHPRFVGRIDDTLPQLDIIGFGEFQVYGAMANGGGFDAAAPLTSGFPVYPSD
jgi:hypothetical protein